LKYPMDVAVDSSGNVLVVDSGHQRILKFTNTGGFITIWGTPGSADGQFNSPHGVTVDSSGYVYVADTGNSRIQKFQLIKAINPCPAGTTQVVAGVCFVTKWGTPGSADGQFMGPGGVSVDSSGHVYVADTGNNRIQVFFWKTDVGGTGGGGVEPGIAVK
jgi:DNA-binding beta-propeller fold protein YncE